MENSFSKLLMVVLENGKVSVHLNQQLEGIEEVGRCEDDDDNANKSYNGVSLLQVSFFIYIFMCFKCMIFMETVRYINMDIFISF